MKAVKITYTAAFIRGNTELPRPLNTHIKNAMHFTSGVLLDEHERDGKQDERSFIQDIAIECCSGISKSIAKHLRKQHHYHCRNKNRSGIIIQLGNPLSYIDYIIAEN